MEVGKEALPAYCHRFSPKVYTQPQLFSCLVLEQFFKADCRGIMGILADTPSLCQAIGLKEVPHWTTLQKASQRLLCTATVQKLMQATVAHVGGDVAGDGDVDSEQRPSRAAGQGGLGAGGSAPTRS